MENRNIVAVEQALERVLERYGKHYSPEVIAKAIFSVNKKYNGTSDVNESDSREHKRTRLYSNNSEVSVDEIDNEDLEEIRKLQRDFSQIKLDLEELRDFKIWEKIKLAVDEKTVVNLFLFLMNKEELSDIDNLIIKSLIEEKNLDQLLEENEINNKNSVLHHVSSTYKEKTFKFLVENVYNGNDLKTFLIKENNTRSTLLHSSACGIVYKVDKLRTSSKISWETMDFLLEKKIIDWEKENAFGETAGDIIENKLGGNVYEEYEELILQYYPELNE